MRLEELGYIPDFDTKSNEIWGNLFRFMERVY